MSTVHEDLLNDFGSSGDEADDGEETGLQLNGKTDAHGDGADSMDVDGPDGEGDKDGGDDDASNNNDAGDDEAAMEKIEKMQLGNVKDVRSVASLMQTLEPILEVSWPPPPPLPMPFLPLSL